MQKIQIAIPAKDTAKCLRWLQDEEIVHIIPLQNQNEAATTPTGYQLAQIQFALEFMQRIRRELSMPEKRSWRDMFAGKPTASLDELEKIINQLGLDKLLENIRVMSDGLAELVAEKQALTEEKDLVAPWVNLALLGQDLGGTKTTTQLLAVAPLAEEERLNTVFEQVPTAVWQIVHKVEVKKQGTLYIEVIAENKDKALLDKALGEISANVVTLTLHTTETPADRLRHLEQKLQKNETAYTEEMARAQSYLQQERNLKFAYDALLHRQEREALSQNIAALPFTTVLEGWIPKDRLQSFTNDLERIFPAAAIESVQNSPDENPPVLFANSSLMRPFEAVTDIYGKPQYNELDPSPALSIFFLLAFGLALTDAGYGIVLMISMAAAEKFFRLKRSLKKMVRLLFYAGFFTVILGALTGGWFGITLENLPPSAIKDILLKIKLIDPVGEPITLLMVAFALGIVQLLFARVVKGYDSWRKGDRFSAIFDSYAWITMILGILAWAGAKLGYLPMSWEKIMLIWVEINAAVLVLTQGRKQKNIIIKLGSGLLSLYGLIGFLSDILSYSRLLALGLATGIIGLVVNLIGGMVIDMVPGVGFLIAAVVLLVGHVFNLGINSLGAFIHSGRLQFVEFFPKFMDGGGTAYKPLGRVSKYVDNPREFS